MSRPSPLLDIPGDVSDEWCTWINFHNTAQQRRAVGLHASTPTAWLVGGSMGKNVNTFHRASFYLRLILFGVLAVVLTLCHLNHIRLLTN